jgi:hypothetical protein
LNVFNSLLIAASFQLTVIFVISLLLKFQDIFILFEETFDSSYKLEKFISLQLFSEELLLFSPILQVQVSSQISLF